MPDTPTFGRYAEIPSERMTAEQQAGYRLMVDGRRGLLPGPYRVWVDNPALVHAEALKVGPVSEKVCMSSTSNPYWTNPAHRGIGWGTYQPL